MTWIKRTTFGLVVIGVITAALYRGSGSATAAESRPPNILFAISDDQSWMHTGANGDPATRTPAFDRVASEGVRFLYAYTAAPSCAPSRSAILTGRHIWELEEGGILNGTLKSKFHIFTHLLEDAGYELGATGKTWAPGKIGEGWTRPLFGKKIDVHRYEKPVPGRNPINYAANFDEFFAQRDKTKPFFFWYGSSEPHQRYDVGSWKRAGKRLEDARLPGGIPDSDVTRGEFLDYGVEIEHFDSHLAHIMETLEGAGELNNTLVIVTSDHGNPMPRSKCNLYDSGTRVPLAIRFPGRIPDGRVSEDFVSLTDIAPTILEAAGIQPLDVMSGRSLWKILTSPGSGRIEPERDFVVTAFERHTICRRGAIGYPMRSIRTERYSYIRNYAPERWPAGDPDYNAQPQGFFGDVDDGESKRYLLENMLDPAVQPYYLRSFGRRPAEELYDLAKDPNEHNNVAADPAYASILREMATRLEEYLVAHGDPRQNGVTPWDTYPYAGRAPRPDPTLDPLP